MQLGCKNRNGRERPYIASGYPLSPDDAECIEIPGPRLPPHEIRPIACHMFATNVSSLSSTAMTADVHVGIVVDGMDVEEEKAWTLQKRKKYK